MYDDDQVQSILGHSTIRVTFDRCGHLFEGQADDLMTAIDDLHENAGVSFSCHHHVTELA